MTPAAANTSSPTPDTTEPENVELTCSRNCPVYYSVPPHAVRSVLGGLCPS